MNHLREAWRRRIEASNEWKKLDRPVRCRLIEGTDYVGDRTTGPEIGQVNYGVEGSLPAGTEGTVLGWVEGETHKWTTDWSGDMPKNVRKPFKLGDHFLVRFPGVASPLLLGQDQIELLDPVSRRKTAIHGVIPWRVRYQGPINVHQPRPVKLDPMAIHDFQEVLYQDEQRKAKEAIEALQAGRAPLEPKTRDLAGTYGIRVDQDCRLLAYPHIDGAWHVMYLGRHDYEEAAHRWANPPDMQRAAAWGDPLYFHGTNAALAEGDHIVPGMGAVHGNDNDVVWVASNAWVASAYGSRTYLVAPDAPPKKRGKAGEFYTTGATVVREMSMAEIVNAGNEWARQ